MQRNRITADAATGDVIFIILDVFLIFISDCRLRVIDFRGVRIGDIRFGCVDLRVQRIVVIIHCRSAGKVRQLNRRCRARLSVLYRQCDVAAGVRFVDALGAFCRIGNDAVVRAAELVSETTQVDFIVPFAVVLRDRQLVVLQGCAGHIAVQSFDIVLQAGNRNIAALYTVQRNRIIADAATGYIIIVCRNRIIIRNLDVCTSLIIFASFNRVIDTINRQPRRSISCSNSTDFRAGSYVKSGCSVAEIDFDVFAICTTTTSNRNATTYFVFAFILARCRVVLAAANEVDGAANGAAISLSCRLDFFNRVASYGFTVVVYLFQCLVELTNGHVG